MAASTVESSLLYQRGAPARNRAASTLLFQPSLQIQSSPGGAVYSRAADRTAWGHVSEFDGALLDIHMGKVKAYYDARISSLEVELSRSQQEAADLRSQLERLQQQTPSMALGARPASPERGRRGSLWEPSGDGRGFFASIVEEVKHTQAVRGQL
jgi:hypothetical protein